jgi:spore germination protein YaaH
MVKAFMISIFGLAAGIIAGIYVINHMSELPLKALKPQRQVIGFLPYWLLDFVKSDYSADITTLTYFALNVDGSGNIVKLSNPQQEEPGWYTLESGKLDPFINNAKKNNIKLSLLISSGNANAINQLMEKPQQHADTLVKDVAPIMKHYGFTDLNLDIEDTSHASQIEQMHFTQFVQTVDQLLNKQKLGTLTVEISPTDAIQANLINLSAISPFANTIILMAYDYHSTASFVTGPVAPLNGAGISLEYDVTTAVEKALQDTPPEKLILGMPLYGYEWETLNTAIRSAIIPGSGDIASNNRMESLLSECATCSAYFDNDSQEMYVTYQNQDTGTFSQIYFPDEQSVTSKIELANKENLSGVALWALGYEGDTMLSPLSAYKQ